MPKVKQILNFEFFEEQQHNLGMKGLKRIFDSDLRKSRFLESLH